MSEGDDLGIAVVVERVEFGLGGLDGDVCREGSANVGREGGAKWEFGVRSTSEERRKK